MEITILIARNNINNGMIEQEHSNDWVHSTHINILQNWTNIEREREEQSCESKEMWYAMILKKYPKKSIIKRHNKNPMKRV